MSHSTTNCYACSQEMRTELLHNHIISNHPTYFWDDLFSFQTQDGVMEVCVGNKPQLREAYNLLHSNTPYKIEPDVFTDFGGNQAYKKINTAINHIQRHTEKHVQNYIDAVKQGLNRESLKQLIAFVMQRQVKVIDDENEVQRRVHYQLNEEKSKFYDEISMMREATHRANLYMERDEIKEINRLYTEIKVLRTRNEELRRDLEQYNHSIKLNDWEDMRKRSLSEIETIREYYDNAMKANKETVEEMKKECDKKMKKMEEDCDKKVKKIKEQISDLTEKYEKIDKKQKKEIKKMQKQIKALQNASDSDSDSD